MEDNMNRNEEKRQGMNRRDFIAKSVGESEGLIAPKGAKENE